jgi:hypothetical protein
MTARVVIVLLGVLAAAFPAAVAGQDLPLLPGTVHDTLVANFYMDESMALLDEPRSRVQMHEYLDMEGDFFFLITQPAGDVTIDEFRSTGGGALQSLTLTMDTATEQLGMVHLLIEPGHRKDAETLAADALESVDQGGVRQTHLYLLGMYESDAGLRQILLREETSSAGEQMYWIHYR